MTQAPIGVLLINLGTPNSPSTRDVRRYLKQFLGDPYVDLGQPRAIWWLILHLIVLPFRPRKSAAMYQKVWTPEGAPLTVFSEKQKVALAAHLAEGYRVEFGYRYGEPSIKTSLSRLAQQGCKQIAVIPLFPQDSSSSYGTALKDLQSVLDRWGNGAPEVEVLPPFFDDPGYIRSLAGRVREAAQDRSVEHYVFSYHGLPVSFIERGEPYDDHCKTTSNLLADELGLSPEQWTHAYQSRFGRAEWLTPATADVVGELGSRYKTVLITCPAFPTDCLETVEEIGILAAETFHASGGEDLIVAPALNDSAEWISVLADRAHTLVAAEGRS